MLKLLLIPLVVIALLGSAVSIAVARRGGGEGDPASHPDEVAAFEIDLGGSVTLPNGAILSYVALSEDSRCPADATCIWQGRAVVVLDMNGEQLTLDSTIEDGVDIAGYHLVLADVQPYPLASQPYDPADSVVTVALSSS